ncbi:unnamed protein product [Cunninghamella blakesleeana]
MHHRRTSSNTSNNGSINYPLFDSTTSMSSVTTSSPPYYPNHLLTVQQPNNNNNNTPSKSSNSNTFVHKLYNMVLDDQYQHLIAWSYTGSSFIVCNIMEFSRDVLPKHFKHNNFSSFVRQLNMYGFHKVNKSPRGHRTLAENQIWEFSHPKFLRGRSELLDEIKRKTMESVDNQQRQMNSDVQAHMNMIQSSQTEMMQQLSSLYENFNHVVKELNETKRKQESQDLLLKNMMQYICSRNEGQLPAELNFASLQLDQLQKNQSKPTPSIFITTPHLSNSSTSSTSSSTTTHSSTNNNNNQSMLHIHDIAPITPTSLGPKSPHPSLTNYLPPSPSTSTMLSDDDLEKHQHQSSTTVSSPNHSLYSPSPYQQSNHHRRHLSTGSMPNSISTSPIHFSQPSSPQPILSSHHNNFDFINPHDSLTH